MNDENRKAQRNINELLVFAYIAATTEWTPEHIRAYIKNLSDAELESLVM